MTSLSSVLWIRWGKEWNDCTHQWLSRAMWLCSLGTLLLWELDPQGTDPARWAALLLGYAPIKWVICQMGVASREGLGYTFRQIFLPNPCTESWPLRQPYTCLKYKTIPLRLVCVHWQSSPGYGTCLGWWRDGGQRLGRTPESCNRYVPALPLLCPFWPLLCMLRYIVGVTGVAKGGLCARMEGNLD